MLVNFMTNGFKLQAHIPGTTYERSWIAKDVEIGLDHRSRIIVIDKEKGVILYSVNYNNCIIDGNIELKLNKPDKAKVL